MVSAPQASTMWRAKPVHRPVRTTAIPGQDEADAGENRSDPVPQC